MTTHKLGVFGNPIAHSRSPEIHAQFGAQFDLSLEYERVLVPAGEFGQVATGFLVDAMGFNVTLPCKREAWMFVDETSEHADIAQAVNTVSKLEGGRLRGDNTDGQGLVNDLGRLGFGVEGRRLLVLGAGGAVNGVLSNLLAGRPASLDICNRTPDKAVALQGRFHGTRAVAAGELDQGYDLIINGTSVGLSEGALSEGGWSIPGHIVGTKTQCYDMMYGADTTLFNRWCLDQAACEVADGLGMLVEQAALAFEIWFGLRPDTAPVLASLRQTLKPQD